MEVDDQRTICVGKSSLEQTKLLPYLTEPVSWPHNQSRPDWESVYRGAADIQSSHRCQVGRQVRGRCHK